MKLMLRQQIPNIGNCFRADLCLQHLTQSHQRCQINLQADERHNILLGRALVPPLN